MPEIQVSREVQRLRPHAHTNTYACSKERVHEPNAFFPPSPPESFDQPPTCALPGSQPDAATRSTASSPSPPAKVNGTPGQARTQPKPRGRSVVSGVGRTGTVAPALRGSAAARCAARSCRAVPSAGPGGPCPTRRPRRSTRPAAAASPRGRPTASGRPPRPAPRLRGAHGRVPGTPARAPTGFMINDLSAGTCMWRTVSSVLRPVPRTVEESGLPC